MPRLFSRVLCPIGIGVGILKNNKQAAVKIPTYLGMGAVGANTSTTSVTPALPASMQQDDIMVIQALCLNTNTPFDIPNTFTEIIQLNVGAHRVGWWWKRRTASATAQPVINTGRTSTNLLAAQVTARRGCINTGTPFEALVSFAQHVAGAIVGIDVTTLGAGRLVEQSFIELGGNVAATPSAPWLESLDQGTTGGGGGRFYTANAPLNAAGTIAAASLTGPSLAYGAIGLAWKSA